MPILGSMLGVFQAFLVPLGTIFSYSIQSIVQLIPGRGATGYAVYFIIFGAIMAIAIGMNVVWRPLGYATTESKKKKEAKEAKKQEKAVKKEVISGKYQELKPEEEIEQDVQESSEHAETSTSQVIPVINSKATSSKRKKNKARKVESEAEKPENEAEKPEGEAETADESVEQDVSNQEIDESPQSKDEEIPEPETGDE